MTNTASTPATAATWGVDSEYGLLRDVLLCSPDNFHWLPTSSVSKATLAGTIKRSSGATDYWLPGVPVELVEVPASGAEIPQFTRRWPRLA